jgi:DNA polymerase
MDIVTIDFETYYDRDYSLSKMTTEAYLRDMLFEVIGVGVKVNDYPTDWYSGKDVGKFLRSLDYRDKAILCHHTAFDGAILSWMFDIKPMFWLDTLSMARPLHNVTVGGSLKALTTYYALGEKGDEVVNALGKRREDFTPEELNRYASYCVNDVELTYKLFQKMKVGFPASELMIIDQTLRMYTEPKVILDTRVLENHLSDVLNKKTQLVDSLGLTGMSEEQIKKVLSSNDIFSKYLQNLGIDPPTKVSPTTNKTTWAFSKTDQAFVDLLEHEDERVQLAVSARLGVKSTIEESRTKGLLQVAHRGALPIMLNYYGAHTGRFSGGDKLNLQNLPRNGAIRRAICAPDGMSFVSCDSAQIEARVLAWAAGQDDLVQAFREGRDVYSEFASDVYGRKITKADKIERFVGKTCILGLGYGMGAEKFQRTLELGQGGISVKLTLKEAKRIVMLYRVKNHKIVSFWNRCGVALQHMLAGKDGEITPILRYDRDGITLPNKFKIKYPALRAVDNNFEYISDARSYRAEIKSRVLDGTSTGVTWTKIYGGKVTENIVQALARIVVSEQMAKVGQTYRVAFQVHDEVVIICSDEFIDAAKQVITDIMSTPPKWAADLPVSCEAGHGKNYGDAH